MRSRLLDTLSRFGNYRQQKSCSWPELGDHSGRPYRGLCQFEKGVAVVHSSQSNQRQSQTLLIQLSRPQRRSTPVVVEVDQMSSLIFVRSFNPSASCIVHFLPSAKSMQLPALMHCTPSSSPLRQTGWSSNQSSAMLMVEHDWRVVALVDELGESLGLCLVVVVVVVSISAVKKVSRTGASFHPLTTHHKYKTCMGSS